MSRKPTVHVIITAAGKGERFGGDLPKQYRILAGKPVLRHAVDILSASANATPQVTIHPQHILYYENIIKGLALPSPVTGGETRRESVYNAVKAIKANDNDIVLIHDGARPNVPMHDIKNLIEAMDGVDAATLALAVSDTLRKGDAIIDRDGMWALQTPQAFRYGVLRKAHETVKGVFTDDTGLVSAIGVTVKIVPGSKANIKITTTEDHAMLEKIMSNKETRTGSGFDVHAFSKEKARKLILCGVTIDHTYGLTGHSDADVGLHAITDALLGAIGEGDIGFHFPPSDNTFKNMDSRIFLEQAADMARDKGASITSVDVTIICENPKISPHREVMRAKIAEILALETSRVNVKGTTTEGLGFTGRGEGIAAQAVVTVAI